MIKLGQLFFRIILLSVAKVVYRIRRIDVQHIPKTGGVLLLPNHVSYIDSFIVYMSCPRHVRFVILESYMNVKAIAWFLKLFQAIPIDQANPRAAIAATVEALNEGSVVCMFPEGGLTRTGVMAELQKGYALIARRAKCPVVPMYMDGLFDSIFSFEREKYFKKWPKRFPCHLQVAFGEPLGAKEATLDRLRSAFSEASTAAFSQRRSFEKSLDSVAIRALRKKRRSDFTFETAPNGPPREWTRAQFTSLAIAMARHWMQSPPDDRDRIGVLLPAGPMPALVNFGLFLAGKTPVNLPMTIVPSDVEKLAQQMETIGVRTVITSKAFIPHLVDFWRGDEGRFIDFSKELAAPGAVTLNFERLMSLWEPAWMTNWRLDLPQRDLQREAIGMIASPDQDADFLTAQQLYKNAMQTTASDFVREGDTLFSELPLNTPGGQLFSFWVPLLFGGRTVQRAFSLRETSDGMRGLVTEQKIDLIFGTHEFFKNTNTLEGLPRQPRFGVSFDQDIDPAEWEKTEEFIGISLCRGWEHSGRIALLSRPEPKKEDRPILYQPSNKAQSPGMLLPGTAGRIKDGELEITYSPSTTGSKNKGEINDKSEPSAAIWEGTGAPAFFDEESFVIWGSESDEKNAC
ncbi:MAG: 1-acyl-sn-glycerol-3-phosphate acyltransferase [Verrucomicrobiota bacterium]